MLTFEELVRYNVIVMQIASGKIIDGRVVVEAELPEGVEVTLLALDGEETFEVDAELEAILLESIAQGERGETISAEELLRELRSRE
jgi:hypothetical protein